MCMVSKALGAPLERREGFDVAKAAESIQG